MRAKTVGAALAVVLVGVGAGCSNFRTELKGRDVGRAICDVKTADSKEQAQRALDKLNRKLDDAQRITGRQVQQDVRDIQNNLQDLTRHADNAGSALKQQDIASIRRNVSTVVQNAPESVKRFYEGVSEGLGDCV